MVTRKSSTRKSTKRSKGTAKSKKCNAKSKKCNAKSKKCTAKSKKSTKSSTRSAKKTTTTGAHHTIALPPVGTSAKVADGVNIIRTDYLENQQVIIATARAKRPEQFKKEPEEHSDPAKCVFCPWNQDKIILEDELPDKKSEYGWTLRGVRNLFGIVQPNGDPPLFPERGNHFFEEINAYGHAEVVIETPDHEVDLEDLSVEHITQYLRFLGRRVRVLQSKPGVRFVSVFKNRGRDAGASITHSHTQLVTSPMIPARVAAMMQANYMHVVRYGRSAYIDIYEHERESSRFVMEDEHAICFTPWASQNPFELWFFPKRQVPSLSLLHEYELASLARMIKRMLQRLGTLGNPAYNMLFICDQEYGELHFHIRLMPRLTKLAGFEFITDMIVNPVPPEDAAKFYRENRKE